MNQNGDPSQAWIKMKPDGRIDVFAGTSDIGNGSKTIQSQIVAETIGVPYDWITYDNSNTDSSPVCTGTFASRATFVAGKAVEKAAERVRERILEIAGKELEIDPSDLEIVDGEVLAKGAPQKKIAVPDVAGAATWTYGELITGDGAQLKPYAAIVDPETGEVDLPPHSAISYAACAAEVEVDDETGVVTVTRLVQVYDVGRALNPTLVEGQIEGGAVQGLGLGVLENCYPYYPSAEHRGGQFGVVPRARLRGPAEDRHDHHREPLVRRAVRREGDRRDGEQRPAARDRGRGVRRRRRLGDGAAGDARACAARARGEGRAGPRGPEGGLRLGALRERRLEGRDALRGAGIVRLQAMPSRSLVRDPQRHASSSVAPIPRIWALPASSPGLRSRPRNEAASPGGALMADSPFASFDGREPYAIFEGVGLQAIAGDQVFLGRVTYAPGTTVARHSHEHTEQVMLILAGSVAMTIGDETKELGPGDVCVVNRGVEHELHSAIGVTFIEALGPVPLDHIPDRERDLVLGDLERLAPRRSLARERNPPERIPAA